MPIIDICAAVQSEAINIVEAYTPDLIDLFPFRRQLRARISLMSGWLGFVMDFKGGSGILQIDQLNTQEREDLSKAAEAKITGTHQDLIETIGSSYFGFERFTYLGPWDGQKLSWPHVGRHLADWMNSYLLPEVLRRNKSRVLRAVPLPPIYNFNDVTKALWILECEQSSQQGTAFYLEGIGLVTCEHVLGSNTMAFQVDSIHQRRPVKIIAKNKDLDLAILQVDGSINGELRKGTADKLSQMDHIAYSATQIIV
ncbi:hypothetical protein A1507_14800 [Methylomonas koyamae]|uniref:Serine protease n=2 Tax=Methylomonas koyamae TaxID=702114 RepID=A0A177NAE0_9GAMM|nr:hypothetical protein A1507_14800 [Methylomonas koyamae]